MVPVDSDISVSALGGICGRRGSIEDRLQELKKESKLLEIVMLEVEMVNVKTRQYKRPEEPVGNTTTWK
jgi:hypothetical protein